MPDEEAESSIRYHVVINTEEQYSIWREGKEPPAGWRIVREALPKADCLAYIDDVWTDMRPLSLRKQMAAASASPKKDDTDRINGAERAVESRAGGAGGGRQNEGPRL